MNSFELWLVSIRTDWLNTIAILLSELCNSSFVIPFFMLGYWFWHPEAFRRVILLTGISIFLSTIFKGVWQLPRPPEAYHLYKVYDWSFPSGHAWQSLTMWGGLALEVKKRWFYLLALVLIIGTCLSRPYLGVHFVRDIIGGLVFGVLTLLAVRRLTDRPLLTWQRLSLWGKLSVLALIELAFFLSYPGDPFDNFTLLKISGALLGFWSCILVEDVYFTNKHFFHKKKEFSHIIFVSVPIMVAFLIFISEGKRLLPNVPFYYIDFIGYFLIGIWLGIGGFFISWMKVRRS